jgi:prepilin peptidase dependent protein B
MLSFSNPYFSNQKGMSLVELMVGMVISLLIIAAAGSTFITTTTSGKVTLNSSKLNVALRGNVDIMVDDIRRAGSWGSTSGDPSTNPFMVQTAGGPKTDVSINAGGSCIEYAYDANGDGVLSSNEYAGFKIESATLKMRNGGTGEVDDCQNGSWESMTDANQVSIQSHSNGDPFFSISYQCLNATTNDSEAAACAEDNTVYDTAAAGSTADLIETRIVTINIGAQLNSDSNMRMELSQRVHLRNHRKIVVGT